MSYRDPDTGEITQSLQRVHYTHEAMVDLLIAEPGITQNEVASHFGYTPGWVSTVINSDAFQAYMAERKGELVDPTLIKTINERLNAVAQLSLDRLLEKVSMPAGLINDDFLIQAAKLSTAALGYGARPGTAQPGVGVQVQVINVPGQMADANAWAAKHAKTGSAVIEELRPAQARLGVDHETPIPLPNARS